MSYLQDLVTRRRKSQTHASGQSEYKSPLDTNQRELAYLSDLAYKTGSTVKLRHLAAAGLSDRYSLAAGKSNPNYTILDRSDGKTILALRGTSNFSDVGTDALLAIGLEGKTKRFHDTAAVIDRLIAERGRDNLILTGHSLGGSIANSFGKYYDIESHAYNPGSNLSYARASIKDKIVDPAYEKKHVIYSTASDPISYLSRNATDYVYVPPNASN